MLSRLRRWQTLRSFDHQWKALPQGQAMLSDARFEASVDAILADELLAIDRAWFRGRRVLDAGCGGGRWTVGLLRLGAEVTAVDASPHALEATTAEAARRVPGAEGRLRTVRCDLLDPALDLGGPFDLVFSFGVLHHTGDTPRALGAIARHVAPGGVLFVYLYGQDSVRGARRALLAAARGLLAPMPFGLKTAALRVALPRRDVHQSFDLLSPLVNSRHTHAEVERWMREAGFTEIARTIAHSEIFLRAARDDCSARPFFRPPAAPPYWFERYRPADAG